MPGREFRPGSSLFDGYSGLSEVLAARIARRWGAPSTMTGMRGVRCGVFLVPVIVVAISLAACAGEEATAPPSTSTTTALAAPSTSAPARDPSVARMAMIGAVTPADLGPAWQEHTPADPDGVPAADECAKRHSADFLESLPPGSTYFGPVSQRGQSTIFMTAVSRVFPDSEQARAYVATLASPEFVACEEDRLSLEEANTGSVAGASYRGEVVPGGDNGIEGLDAHVSFQFQATVDGNLQDANGLKAYYVVREDRTVVLLVLEAVYQPTDPADVATLLGQELARGVEAAVGRLKAESN